MTEKASELERKRLLSGFECPEGYLKRRSGNDSMMDTPVPIPNTEVKHHRGEDSTLCENSSLPVPSFFYAFLFIKKSSPV